MLLLLILIHFDKIVKAQAIIFNFIRSYDLVTKYVFFVIKLHLNCEHLAI